MWIMSSPSFFFFLESHYCLITISLSISVTVNHGSRCCCISRSKEGRLLCWEYVLLFSGDSRLKYYSNAHLLFNVVDARRISEVCLPTITRFVAF